MNKAISAALLGAALLAPLVGARAQDGPPFFPREQPPLRPAAALAQTDRMAAVEREASDLALRRSRNRAVRALASRLEAHAQIMSSALDALSMEGVRVPSADLTGRDEQNLEQLARLREPNFDTRYVEIMRGVYEEWMSALRTYADQGGPGPARDFVRQILPRARRNYAEILSAQDRT